MKRLLVSIAGLTALVLLAGCGIKTGLDRPNPMWSAEEAQAREAAREAQDAADQAERDRRRGVTPAPTTATPPTTSPDSTIPSGPAPTP
jgi:predicted small lipoprotein YifL